MHRFTLFIALAAIVLTTGADAASRKKPGAAAERPGVTASKQQKPQRAARPAAQSRQGWPTSWSDGSFRYGD
jgi:hypothetical protein